MKGSKLLNHVREVIRINHFSYSTEKTYIEYNYDFRPLPKLAKRGHIILNPIMTAAVAPCAYALTIPELTPLSAPIASTSRVISIRPLCNGVLI